MSRVAFISGVFLLSLASAEAQDCVGPMPGRCSLLDSADVIFVGTVVENTSGFRVTEAFKGVKGDHVEVFELYGRHFELGKQYLVFGQLQRDAGRPFLTRSPCSPTVPLEQAAAILDQLRAEKSGRRVAAVYGTLVRTVQEGGWMWEDEYPRPLPNIVVRLQSDGKSFETRTDQHGVYAFDRLPPGRYQVSADLPPNLVLGQQILEDPVPPFDLPRGSCFDNDLYALPTGRITGHVIGPDRKPLRPATANLYRASKYKAGERGIWSCQCDWGPLGGWKPFDFSHLPADDYVLVFNSENKEDPNTPFPMTFYPSASSLESSQPIHLSDGQQVLDADIHVSNPLPTRQITVRLDWRGRTPQDSWRPQLIAKSSRGMPPHLIESGRDTYTLNLLLTARYTMHIEALCIIGMPGKVETDEVTIDGSSLSPSEVTLAFDKGDCTRK